MYGSPGFAVVGVGSGNPVPAVPFEQPKNLFRYGEQALWSTYHIAAGAPLANATFRLFSTALGASGQGFNAMTIAETNIKESGRIPAGIAFDAYGLSCAVQQGVGANTDPLVLNAPTANEVTIGNLINIIQNSALTWDFTQTQVDVAPLHLIGAGGGAYGAVAASNAAAPQTLGNMNNGVGSIWLYRQHPVSLPGNSTFTLLLRFGAYAAATGAGYQVAVKTAMFGFYKNVIEIG